MGDVLINKSQPILALPGPQYSFDYSKGLPIGDGVIAVHQEGGAGRGTAWNVWDGATATALYLDCLVKTTPHPPWLRNLLAKDDFTILELGSGTGLAGLAAAAVFQNKVKGTINVILTDLAEALPALKNNVAANPSLQSIITVTECNWFKPNIQNIIDILGGGSSSSNNKLGILVAADCVWLEDLVGDFVATLEELIRKAGSMETRVLLGYQSRSQRVDDLLFGLLKKNFTIEATVPLAGESYGRGKIEISWLHPLPCLC
jgi:hypothetical protein